MKEGELIKIFMKIKRLHHKRSQDEFRKIEVSKGQPKILNYLSDNNGSIQKDIAENCNIEPATATNILATMERSGFIVRKANINDKRILNVYLTDKGKITQDNVQKVICTIEEECFKGFTEKEKEMAMDFFNRMYNNLSKGERNKNV